MSVYTSKLLAYTLKAALPSVNLASTLIVN